MERHPRVHAQLALLGSLFCLIATLSPRRGMRSNEPPGSPHPPKVVPAARPPAALSPQMIPQLDDTTRRILEAGRKEPGGTLTEEIIRRTTRNPFITLALDDLMVARMPAPVAATTPVPPEPGAGTASFGLRFVGVVTVEGETYAVLDRPGRHLPYFVREGEGLPGLDTRLLKIWPDSRGLVLHDLRAVRAKDRIRTLLRQPGTFEEVAELRRVLSRIELPQER